MSGHVSQRGRIGLVGCVKSKLDHPAAARDLYTSPLFFGRRTWVEGSCDRWFIISAKHGLVAPDQRLEPYEYTLKGKGVAIKRAWAERVLGQIDGETGPVRGLTFELHAGKEYLDFGLEAGLRVRGAHVEKPVDGVGFGKQLKFYAGGAP